MAGNLLDAIFSYFDESKNKTDEQRAANAIALLEAVQDQSTLNAVLTMLPAGVALIPSVTAARAVAENRTTKNKDRGPFGSVPEALIGGFSDLAADIGQGTIGALQSGMTAAAPAAEALAGAVLQPVIDMVITTMEAGGHAVPAQVRAQLAGVLMPIISLGLTLEITTDLAELIMPTKNMGLGGVSHFLHDTVGFKALTESYVYPIRHSLIEQPTIYNINRLTQPNYIGPTQARVLVWKRLLSPEKYADVLRVHGIREEFVPALQADVWRELSIRDLQRAYDVDTVPDDFARATIRRGGLSDDDVEVVLKSLKKRVLVKELGDIRILQRSQYKDGTITKTQYLEILQRRDVTGSDAQELIAAVDAENRHDALEEDRALYEKKFLDGRATQAELEAALGRLEKTPEFITSRIARLTEQKLGKLKLDDKDLLLSRADIIKQYNQGKLSRAAVIKALDDRGFSAADAMAIADLEDQDARAAVQAENIRAAEQKAKNLRLSLKDLIAAYVANGKSQAWADARASYINELIVGKTPTTEEQPAA